MTCAKQIVTATIVALDGTRYVGRNDCRKPQLACPRGAMPSGTGYHLCKQVCAQDGHAEVMALRRAGSAARGAALYLVGHSYICEACAHELRAAGVAATHIAAPPGISDGSQPHDSPCASCQCVRE